MVKAFVPHPDRRPTLKGSDIPATVLEFPVPAGSIPPKRIYAVQVRYLRWVVMKNDVTDDQARAALEACQGNVRKAVAWLREKRGQV